MRLIKATLGLMKMPTDASISPMPPPPPPLLLLFPGATGASTVHQMLRIFSGRRNCSSDKDPGLRGAMKVNLSPAARVYSAVSMATHTCSLPVFPGWPQARCHQHPSGNPPAGPIQALTKAVVTGLGIIDVCVCVCLCCDARLP